MYKKLACILLFGFLIIAATSATHEFKVNDGFTPVNEYYSENDENGMRITVWDYDDEDLQEAYLQNNTDYSIIPGDNNTYNVTYNSHGTLEEAMSYVKNGNITLDHGILEIAEIDGFKYIIMAYMDEGSEEDWGICFDELMKFNENNEIEPLVDAV